MDAWRRQNGGVAGKIMENMVFNGGWKHDFHDFPSSKSPFIGDFHDFPSYDFPDGSIVELFKYLDSSNVDSLTNCLNALWRAKLVPDDFTQAHIASLYKKGDHENPENYRPISLLNVSYKIYAYILKSRLAMALEEHLRRSLVSEHPDPLLTHYFA